MNRRGFLKSALSAAALASIPTPLIAAFEAGEIDTIKYGDIEITFTEIVKNAVNKHRKEILENIEMRNVLLDRLKLE